MSTDIFNFKHFRVDQSNCAMKIGTDGVLLGALANHANPINILDIGTGTGVVALMLAQRFPQAHIVAIEVDELAARQAQENVEMNGLGHRIDVLHADFFLQDFEIKFDLIVSNPPFFVNSLENKEERLALARHTSSDFHTSLVKKAAGLLAASGRIVLVLPSDRVDILQQSAQREGLVLIEQINIRHRPFAPIKRQIISLGTQIKGINKNSRKEFFLRNEDNKYSKDYKNTLKDFLTIF